MPDENDLRWLTDPLTFWAESEAVVFTGLSLSHSKGGNDWFLVIRATKGGKPVVAYIGAATVEEAWLAAGYLATVKRGIRWFPDKYRS